MTAQEALTLAWVWAAGAGLGAIFFGGLWWTVHRGVSSKHPALWFCASLLLRAGIALAGLTWISGRDWKRWLLCFLGFVMARLVVMSVTTSPGGKQTTPVLGGGHAP